MSETDNNSTFTSGGQYESEYEEQFQTLMKHNEYYYTPSEFAKQVGVCTGTVYAWLHDECIHGERIPKKVDTDLSEKFSRWKIAESELRKLHEYLHANTVRIVRVVPRVMKRESTKVSHDSRYTSSIAMPYPREMYTI